MTRALPPRQTKGTSMTELSTHLEILGVTKRGERSSWNRVGTAFPTKDGKGYRLRLDFIPVKETTEIVLLPPKEQAHGGEGQ